MNIISRTLTKIHEFGFRETIGLLLIRIEAVKEPFFPKTIWGERVGLRSIKYPLTDAEIERIHGWSRDEEVLRWSGGKKSELSLDEFQAQVRRERWIPQSNQRLFYVVTKENGIIGRIGLFSIDWSRHEGEFGISIEKKYWDKRFGREATKLFLRYMFAKTPIERIYLGTFQDNIRAQRSFAASGFRVTGVARRFLPNEGKYVDGVEMEITAGDIKKMRHDG